MERQNSISFMIRTLSNLHRRKVFEVASPPRGEDAFTETEGLIMGYLCDHRGETLFQRDVEAVFCIRRSTASRFLKHLERDGMLLRQSVPQDARLKKLVLTDKALGIHMEIEAKTRGMEQRMTEGITEEELSAFFAVARKIQRNLSE